MGITAGGMIILLAISGGLPEIMWLGDQGMAGSGASAGMGNTFFADASPQGALENPVMASELKPGFTAGVSGRVVLDVEKRTRRVYDSFGGVVGESEYSFNQSFTPLPGGVALSWANETFAVACGWRAASTFAYEFNRTINNDSYVKVAEEDLSVSGILSDISASGSWSSGGMFSFGVGGGFLSGTRSTDHSIFYIDPTVPDLQTQTDTDISGMILRGSALADMGRVLVSAGAEQPVGWNLSSGGVDTDLTIPFKVRTGIIYKPGNRLMTLFATDMWWSPTSGSELDGADAGLRNSWGFGAGVENTLPGNAIVRAGFEYDSSPMCSALDRMGFTAGIGWVYDEVAVDAAVSFSPARWDQYQADGLLSFIPGDSLVVESSRTAFSLGVTKTF